MGHVSPVRLARIMIRAGKRAHSARLAKQIRMLAKSKHAPRADEALLPARGAYDVRPVHPGHSTSWRASRTARNAKLGSRLIRREAPSVLSVPKAPSVLYPDRARVRNVLGEGSQ